jgi:hypothetical protein
MRGHFGEQYLGQGTRLDDRTCYTPVITYPSATDSKARYGQGEVRMLSWLEENTNIYSFAEVFETYGITYFSCLEGIH